MNYDKELTLDTIEIAIEYADESLLKLMLAELSEMNTLKSEMLAAKVNWRLATEFVDLETIDLSDLDLTAEEIAAAKIRFEQAYKTRR